MKLSVRFPYIAMRGRIEDDTLQFADLAVDIESMNERDVKPAPFRISKTSKWSREPWDPEFGAQFDVADCVEYRGRCLMALAAFTRRGTTLTRAEIAEVLEDFVVRQFSKYDDAGSRAGEPVEETAERVVREMASQLRIHDGRLYVVDVVPVYAVVEEGDPLCRGGDGKLSIEIVPSRQMILEDWESPPSCSARLATSIRRSARQSCRRSESPDRSRGSAEQGPSHSVRRRCRYR
ncbi:hypothetical protein RX329_32410 [Bradyrhizobium sp. BWC-3-1]|nr:MULTISPECIES: hypothetical protein [Bradyrhizobium]WOH56913.1 hypothetical protein RX329_32410 [Bradyrhizobium sp. BWC-3-1]